MKAVNGALAGLSALALALGSGCVSSDNGFALYPLYYHATSERGRSETYWAACGLLGWKSTQGHVVTDWLVPLYARTRDSFFSLPYSSVDDGREGDGQFYLAGLGGRIRGERGVVEHDWWFPFYYRDPASFVSLFYGSLRDSSWVFPLYYRSDRWNANLFYASKEVPATGESGWVLPLLLTGYDRDETGVSAFWSLPYGWTGRGSSQTNAWYATPLVGAKSGRENGWWVQPLFACSTDVGFDESERHFAANAMPDAVTFPLTEAVDFKGDKTVISAQKGSVRAKDERTYLMLFDDDTLFADGYSQKEGCYRMSRRRKVGNEWLVGVEKEETKLFDAASRGMFNEGTFFRFSLFGRLLRYESDSADGSRLDLLFMPVWDGRADEDPKADLSDEARGFLSKRPAGGQAAQAQAVRAALSGDMSALERMRLSRDVERPLLSGVTRKYVRKDLCLYLPASGRAERTLVYLHGGCWVIGGINSCSDYCMAVAQKGVAVLAYAYPLAPENSPEAIVGGCREALAWSREHAAEWGGDAARISVGGDSAGGNLALALAMAADVPPTSLLLYYPVTRAWADGSSSWRRYGAGCGLDADFMEAGNEAYARWRRRDPLVSPACAEDAEVRALPPCHFLAAQCDILFDQGRAFHERLCDLGVESTHETVEGAVHLFVTVPGQPKAFARAVDFAAKWTGR